MIFLPDVNVWVALAAERHVHHRAARQWFSRLQDGDLAFCRITQMGFLRLLTNKHVMQEEAVSPDGAWQAYRIMRSDRRVVYLSEPDNFSEDGWEEFTEGQSSSPNRWTDAYLAALAQTALLTLVTFDRRMPVRLGSNYLVLGEMPGQ
jgi:toxin-antitoxin system PIN domain toxin